MSHVWRYETCFVLSSLFISQRTNKKLWFQSLCQNLDGAAAAAPSCSLCLDFDDGTKPPSHQLWPTIKPLRYNLTNLKTGWHRPHIAPRCAAYLASICQFNTNPTDLGLNTEKTCSVASAHLISLTLSVGFARMPPQSDLLYWPDCTLKYYLDLWTQVGIGFASCQAASAHHLPFEVWSRGLGWVLCGGKGVAQTSSTFERRLPAAVSLLYSGLYLGHCQWTWMT